MSSPTYQAIGFVANDSDFTVARAAERWRALRGVDGLAVEVKSEQEALVSFGGWELRLMLGEGEWVLAEARDTAEAHPEYCNAASVAKCRRMISVSSYDPDPNMDHFNDYLLTVESLLFGFPGVYLRDTASGIWYDEGRS